MGGVDVMDACIARYKYHIISKRWYLYLFWQGVYIALVNAWLLYRRECKEVGVAKNSILNQRKFQAIVAQTLIQINTKKPGRPSTPVAANIQPVKRQQKRPLANDDVGLDKVAHWPLKDEKRRRCAICKVNKTDTTFEKCKVALCFTEKRNCFREYHKNRLFIIVSIQL
ncbi:piggyBac transposable element-derived protein 2-like [Antedon mediterranea]|uniref:piggyBac transposable element-derived protein 2-like n=1 Tax=Antedon mediterranea TaxID=105859 RepID=UPI003AF6ED27